MKFGTPLIPNEKLRYSPMAKIMIIPWRSPRPDRKPWLYKRSAMNRYLIQLFHQCSEKTFFPSWKNAAIQIKIHAFFQNPLPPACAIQCICDHLLNINQVIASESVSICSISSHSKWQNPRKKNKTADPTGHLLTASRHGVGSFFFSRFWQPWQPLPKSVKYHISRQN